MAFVPKSGKLDPEDTWSNYDAVHIWVPALEEKPQPGWLVNDGLHCGVTWLSGMDLKCLAETYWMELGMARREAARVRGETPTLRSGRSSEVGVVHIETPDGVVHVFEVAEEWRIETTARERPIKPAGGDHVEAR